MSLTFGVRAITIASLSLIAICGILIIEEELDARQSRAALEDFWIPARTMNRELLAAEKVAEQSITALIASPSSQHRRDARLAIADLRTAVSRSTSLKSEPATMDFALEPKRAAQSWLDQYARSFESDASTTLLATSLRSERALMQNTSLRLAQINARASDVRDSLNQLSTTLRTTIAIETALLISLLILLILGLKFRVLTPLLTLRQDLDRSARQLVHVIKPSGPREISAVAQDAEQLRRSLIHEHDVSDHATEALVQASPLTLAFRAELDRQVGPVPGVIGVHFPVEGLIAGDWWWAGKQGSGTQLLAIADVSGHGVAAGMLALETRTLVSRDLMALDSPEVICSQLALHAFPPGMFVTLFVGVIKEGTLKYCSAGHPNAAVVSEHGVQELFTTGPVISALGGSWVLGQLPFERGSALLLATDGLLDQLPEADFSQLAQRAWLRSGGTAQECLDALVGQAREATGVWKDDVTVMIATAKS
ncbi:MAG: PP2C family protein-serine/threonine phosphatase [Actinomycetota bacterium]|nr:PP2C family protein-serine/threonine phosphatase [Actinomycetota bacterium]